jgi:hypothetical protein
MLIDFLASASDKKADHKPIRLVCPLMNSVPVDSLLSFEVVESIKDLFLDRNANSVLMFDVEGVKILDCWASFEDLFQHQAVVLTGVPGADYGPEFESVGFKLEKVAYHSAVADLIEAARRSETMSDAEKESSIYAKEKAGFTRGNGNVKAFTAFDAPNMPLSHVDLEAEGVDVLGDDGK